MSFLFSDEQRLIQQTVKEIARKELAPRSAEIDQYSKFPLDGVEKLTSAGILGMTVPQEYGGSAADDLSFVLAVEEIARACASTALITVTHEAVCRAILVAGNETQKGRFLPPLTQGEKLGAFAVHEVDSGADASAITTRAVTDGDDYIVNGTKMFITNAREADIFLVLVRTDDSNDYQDISLLTIEKDTPGFSLGAKYRKMGLNGIASNELIFQDCRVPKENLLGSEGNGIQTVVKSLISLGFLGAAAISLGLANEALERSILHARERVIRGKPIGTHQGIQFLVAEMGVSVDAIGSLLYWTVLKKENSDSNEIVDALKVKLYASELAIEVTDRALQVHGGHGYSDELPLERFYRDARGLSLHFKTTELLKGDIGRALLNL
jgi:butyryl-CoA dehydrogenase